MSLWPELRYLSAVHLVGGPALRWVRWSDARKLRNFRRPDSPLHPPLVSTARMKELMARHYLAGQYANGVKKVAWVTSGAPVEVLKALGFHLFYPENHAAMCGARRKAQGLIEEAEQAGYSQDICSYARTDMGAALSGKHPLVGLPRPDLLLACTNICQTVLHWYRVLAAHFGAPLVLVDTPFLYDGAEQHQVDYVRRQIEEMIPVAEQVAGKRLSHARFTEVIEKSKEACELWLQVLERARTRPSPLTAFDCFVNMGPIVDLRGDETTLTFYRQLLAELDDRIARGVGAVKDERKRVLWDNLPIWFRIGRLSKFLAKRGVNVVAATYTNAWAELAPMMDPTRPMDSMARVYLHALLNRSAGDKLATMHKLIEGYSIDGVILHSDRSCKPYSLGQMDQCERLAKGLGVAAVLLDADHNDPRAYADEPVEGRLEAFVETLEAS